MKTKSDERLDLRMPATIKERLRKVAAMSGRSMSDFIIGAAIEKAEEVTASIERWELDEVDSHVVIDALMNHRELPELRALLHETKQADAPALVEA